MRTRLHLALLFPLACLLGCTLPYTQPPQTITCNWQIQSGTAITSPPTAPYLVGALQGTDSALTGTFNTAQPGTVSPQVLSYSGTYNTATGSLILNSTVPLQAEQITAALSVPTDPTTLSTVTLQFQCIPCNNTGYLSPVVGVEVAPLNGTYTGTLTDSSTPSMSGTASLTLTQSDTPNSSGQFPLTGTIIFPSNSGLGSAVSLSGTVSGIGITLNRPQPCGTPPVCEVVVPSVVLTAFTNSTAAQITISHLTYSGDTTATFAGTLTLQ